VKSANVEAPHYVIFSFPLFVNYLLLTHFPSFFPKCEAGPVTVVVTTFRPLRPWPAQTQGTHLSSTVCTPLHLTEEHNSSKVNGTLTSSLLHNMQRSLERVSDLLETKQRNRWQTSTWYQLRLCSVTCLLAVQVSNDKRINKPIIWCHKKFYICFTPVIFGLILCVFLKLWSVDRCRFPKSSSCFTTATKITTLQSNASVHLVPVIT
jgi:hypothetical protein